jgi:hypothetical protein
MVTYCVDHRYLLPFMSTTRLRNFATDTLTRTAKHSDQFAGTTTVITDGYDIIEYTVIGLSEICKDIDEDIRSLGHDCQSFDLK